MSLLRSQRNQLFQLLQDQEDHFSPSGFEWVERTSTHRRFGTVPAWQHIPTGFMFIVDQSEYAHGESGFLVRYSPGQEMDEEVRDIGSWEGVPSSFRTWLGYVQRETELPDLWESLTKDTQLIQDMEQQSSDNLPFTDATNFQRHKRKLLTLDSTTLKVRLQGLAERIGCTFADIAKTQARLEVPLCCQCVSVEAARGLDG